MQYHVHFAHPVMTSFGCCTRLIIHHPFSDVNCGVHCPVLDLLSCVGKLHPLVGAIVSPGAAAIVLTSEVTIDKRGDNNKRMCVIVRENNQHPHLHEFLRNIKRHQNKF